MQNYELSPAVHTNPCRWQQITHQPTEESKHFASYDPWMQMTSPSNAAVTAQAHATRLNQATAGRPAQAARALVQLQRQYGNHYVQRVLSIARQGDGEAEASPEIEQSIQQARGGG